MLELTFAGFNDWSYPVYKGNDGNRYVDIDMGESERPNIHTIEGEYEEPGYPVKDFVIIEPQK